MRFLDHGLDNYCSLLLCHGTALSSQCAPVHVFILSDHKMFFAGCQQALQKRDINLSIRPCTGHHAEADPHFIVIMIEDFCAQIRSFTACAAVQGIIKDQAVHVIFAGP